jgi:hypothetical protein
MEPWSDNQIHADFKVKFFLDTNILSYLVDKTFSGLTKTIKFLVECSFVELKSSRYVIFEFVGIRKKEHFMRSILKRTTSKSGKVNLSSLLKYREGFAHDGLDYFTESKSIRRKVLRELEKITSEFDVDYKTHEIHTELWKPTFDIILSSKISREDAMVLISCVFPNTLLKEDKMLLLTNDTQFENATKEVSFQRKLNSYFKLNKIEKPEIIHIERFTCNGSTVNLAKKTDDTRAVNLMFAKVQEHQIEHNKIFFLGKTIAVPNAAPPDVICFELLPNTTLYNNVYLVFIGKDLSFYYTTKIPVGNFLDNMQPLNYPFKAQDPTRLAFRLQSVNPDGSPIIYHAGMLPRLRESGNLIFIHPDSILP